MAHKLQMFIEKEGDCAYGIIEFLENHGMVPPDTYWTDGQGTEIWTTEWETEDKPKNNMRIKSCDWCGTIYRWNHDPKSESKTIEIYCEMCDTTYHEKYI